MRGLHDPTHEMKWRKAASPSLPPVQGSVRAGILKPSKGVVLDKLISQSSTPPDKEAEANKLCSICFCCVESVGSKPDAGFAHWKGRLPKSPKTVLLGCICPIVKLPEPSQF